MEENVNRPKFCKTRYAKNDAPGKTKAVKILAQNKRFKSGIYKILDPFENKQCGDVKIKFTKENSIIIKHVGQRFLIPYIIGSTAYFLNIEYFIIFKIVTFVSILIYIFLINLIVIKFNLKCKESILFFSLLFLNPYIIRYQIFNPLQAHDILFFCLSLAFVLTIIQKKFFSYPLLLTIMEMIPKNNFYGFSNI